MGNSGGMCCIRASLVIFNLITLLAGVGTLVIGCWLFFQSQVEGGEVFLEDVSKAGGIPNHGEFMGFSLLLIGLGGIVALVSFLGCFGACVNSRCLLLCYLTSIVVILSLQLLVAIFAILYKEPFSASIEKELLETLKGYKKVGNETENAWDTVHRQFECCGVNSYTDWFKHEQWPGENFVPDSCCIENKLGCGRIAGGSEFWAKEGCLPKIQLWILQRLHILASAIITLVFLQLYGIIASTLLFYQLKTPKSTPNVYKSYGYERAGLTT